MLELGVRILDELRRKVFGRPTREVDVDLGLVVVVYLNRRAPQVLAESNKIFLTGGEDA